MNEIEIHISPTGESRIETRGFTGNQCREASKFLREALGKQTKEKLKPTFYSKTEAQGSIEQNS